MRSSKSVAYLHSHLGKRVYVALFVLLAGSNLGHLLADCQFSVCREDVFQGSSVIIAAPAGPAAAAAVAAAAHNDSLPAAAAAAAAVGAVAAVAVGAVWTPVLRSGQTKFFSGSDSAAIGLKSIKIAATTAAAEQLAMLLLLASAQSTDTMEGKKIFEHHAGDKLPSKSFLEQLQGIEIPTVSAAISSGVDRAASAVLRYFLPDAQLPQEAASPPRGHVSRGRDALPSLPAASVTAPRKTAAATDGSTTTRKAGLTETTAGGKPTTATAPRPRTTKLPARALEAAETAAAATKVARAIAATAKLPAGDGCDSTDRLSSCALTSPKDARWKEPLPQAGGKTSVPPAMLGDIASSFAFPAPSSAPHSPSLTNVMSAGSAQGRESCPTTAGKEGTCQPQISQGVEEVLFPISLDPAETRQKQAETLPFFSPAAGEQGSLVSSAAAAAEAQSEGSSSLPHSTYEAAGRARMQEAVALRPVAVGATGRWSGAAQLSTAHATEKQRHSSNLFRDKKGERIVFDGMELTGKYMVGSPGVGVSPDLPPRVGDVSTLQDFLVSLNLGDPPLWILLGLHLLLFAAVLRCRRMHGMQLLLMVFVSVLLLCSKHVLLLCSLVEQKLRTDDSLASALAAFSSTPLSSAPASFSSPSDGTAAQFYCSPSAAARAAHFLLVFWWLPLFAALLLLVGMSLQELVASMRLLTSCKAKAKRNSVRSGESAGTAEAVHLFTPSALATSNAAKEEQQTHQREGLHKQPPKKNSQ